LVIADPNLDLYSTSSSPTLNPDPRTRRCPLFGKPHGPFDRKVIKEIFGDLEFPANPDELIAKASDRGTSQPFLHALRQLPDQEYASLDQVVEYLNSSGQGARPGA
jgi:hypothetical protein